MFLNRNSKKKKKCKYMASIFPYSKFRLRLTWKCVYVCVRQRAPLYMNIYTSAWETSYMDILHETVGKERTTVNTSTSPSSLHGLMWKGVLRRETLRLNLCGMLACQRFLPSTFYFRHPRAASSCLFPLTRTLNSTTATNRNVSSLVKKKKKTQSST